MLKKDVIEYFGSIREVAKALDISTQAVHQWKEKVPESAAYKIEVISKGELRVE